MGTWERRGAMAGLVVALILGAAGCATQPEPDSQANLSAMLAEVASNAERSYDYGAAVGHYNTLYERDPGNVDALLGLARNLRYVGSPTEAIKVLKHGVATHGELPAILVELGKAQIAAALMSEARETLTRVLALDPKNWQVHSALGVLYDRIGLYEAAEEAYNKALELSPDNSAVINNLGLSLALAGKLDEGIRTLEKLRHSENSIPQARQNLAMLYALKGDFRTAEKLSREDLPAAVAAKNIAAFRRLRGPGDAPAPGSAAVPDDAPAPGPAVVPDDVPAPGSAAVPDDTPASGPAATPYDVP